MHWPEMEKFPGVRVNKKAPGDFSLGAFFVIRLRSVGFGATRRRGYFNNQPMAVLSLGTKPELVRLISA